MKISFFPIVFLITWVARQRMQQADHVALVKLGRAVPSGFEVWTRSIVCLFVCLFVSYCLNLFFSCLSFFAAALNVLVLFLSVGQLQLVWQKKKVTDPRLCRQNCNVGNFSRVMLTFTFWLGSRKRGKRPDKSILLPHKTKGLRIVSKGEVFFP